MLLELRLISLLLFCMLAGVLQETPEVDYIERYNGTNGCAYEIVELDIEGVETIYVPFWNKTWRKDIHEFLSREPSKRGTLTLLAQKTCVSNPFFQDPDDPSHYGKRGLGNVDEKHKRLWCGYLKSHNGKEIYISSFGEWIFTDGVFSIDLQIQKPDNVKIQFYHRLKETPFPSLLAQIQKDHVVDNEEQLWTRIESVPTNLRRLPGMLTEAEKQDGMAQEQAATPEAEPEQVLLSLEEIRKQQREFWFEGGVEKMYIHQKKAFESSVEEHNQKVEKIRKAEADE